MGTTVRDIAGGNAVRIKAKTDVYSTSVTVADTFPISEDQNFGQARRRTYGDGRQWSPILTATPGTLVPGQYWFERVAGVDYLKFVDTTGVVRTIVPGAGAGVTPVSLSVGANTIASFNTRVIGLATFYVGVTKGAARGFYRVDLGHDGQTAVDATTTQMTVTGGVVVGSIDPVFSRTLTGTGVNQVVNLILTPTVSGWSSFTSPDLQVPT